MADQTTTQTEGDDEMSTRVEQIREHGVDAARFPFASFCFGRGWRGHRTAEAASKAALKDALACQRSFGGGLPQYLSARTDTGETVTSY